MRCQFCNKRIPLDPRKMNISTGYCCQDYINNEFEKLQKENKKLRYKDFLIRKNKNIFKRMHKTQYKYKVS